MSRPATLAIPRFDPVPAAIIAAAKSLFARRLYRRVVPDMPGFGRPLTQPSTSARDDGASTDAGAGL